ncbi:hypothetical protein QYF61_007733 [Mycteria americana]|uniref:Uncharacterized protein n=1 Tax=Mycteria americana TaxID=33587 RepID=A0AAN7MR25_MYCAM|nr:hypothetical protein QYF61_007733 [Mycteria americana]
MRKDFSHHPGEHVLTWLLRCWDNGASSLELEGKEAKQLGSLSREGGIDKVIGKGAPALSLWRRLLSAMKKRYPFQKDVVYRPGKWTTMEKGIRYPRELAVLEVVYGDLNNELLCKNPWPSPGDTTHVAKVGTEAQLLLAPRLPVLGWMFKGRVPSTHHATDATWSKLVALITQQARIGNPSRSEILEVIMDWPESKDFGISPEEEVTRAEEAPLYNKLPENEKQYALFTDGSCRSVGKHWRWKAAVGSPI